MSPAKAWRQSATGQNGLAVLFSSVEDEVRHAARPARDCKKLRCARELGAVAFSLGRCETADRRSPTARDARTG